MRNLKTFEFPKRVVSLLLVTVMLITGFPVTFPTEVTAASSIDSPGIVTTKSVSYDSATGGYNLNIEAYVTGKTVDNVTGVPLDIVIVMDHSNSMPECVKCAGGLKLSLTRAETGLSTSRTYYLESSECAYYCNTCKAWYTQIHSDEYNYHEGIRLVPFWCDNGNLTDYVVPFYTKDKNACCGTTCSHGSYEHPIYEAYLNTASTYTYYRTDSDSHPLKYCSGCGCWYKHTSANEKEHTGGDHGSSDRWYPLRSATEEAKVDKFYTPGTCSVDAKEHIPRYAALYDAVTAFLENIESDAKGSDGVFGTTDDVKHRIAFVSFAGDSTGEDSTNAILSCTPGTLTDYSNRIPYKLIDGDNENNTVYNNSFQDVTTYDGRKIANTCLNNRLFSANTQTTKGMKMAYKLFTLNTTSVNEAASGDRSRVCIVFTDGEPTDTPADSIKIGAQIHDLKVPVYTVGTFSNASVAVPATAAEVKALPATSQYMHLLSSNYPDAVGYSNTDNMGLVNPDVTVGEEAYFLSSTTTDGLKAVFQKIYSQIESPDVNLGSSTVLQDVVSSGFIVDTSRTTTAQVKYYSNNAVVRSITPSINGNTVTVTGFDYSANFVNTSTKAGQKMVLTIPIQPASTAAGVLPTNVQASSGIYYGGDLLETLPLPYAEVPATVTVKKDCLTTAVNVSGTGFSGSYTGGGSGGTLSMGTNSYSVQSTNLATQLTPKLKLGTNLYISGANSGVTVSVSGSTATQSGDNWVIPVKQGMVVTVTKHNIVVDAYKAPTCTATGLTESKHCTGCSTQTVAQTTIAATGHNYKLKETVAATYFADGYEYRECLNDPSHNYKTTLAMLTDTSAPTVNATYPTPTVTEDDKVYFGSDVTVNATANDAESHIKEATYTVTNTDTNTTYSSGDLTINGANAVGNAPITSDGYYTVTVSATNTQDKSASTTTKTIVVDKTAPVIKETANVPYESVTLNITDRHLTTVTVNGEPATVDSNGNITLTREYGTGDKTFTVVATDIVGNSTTYEVTIAADVTPPYVDIVHTPEDEYNDGPVDVIVSARDDESGIKNIRYTVKLNGEILENYDNVVVDSNTVTENFTADGYYEITAISTNNEGLESEQALESFTIDTTDPVITLPTEGKLDGNIYCNSPDGIVVGITELNPEVITVTKPDGSVTTIVGGIPTILLTGSLEGSTYTVKIVDKAGNEATETVTVYDQHPFGEWETVVEATYTSTGLEKRTCTVCGHEEERVTEIIPDPTAPVLDAFIENSDVVLKDGKTDYFTYKPVTVTVTANDGESLIEEATYTLTKDGEVVGTYPLTVSEDGKTATADALLEEDGEYTITVNATNTQGKDAELVVDTIIIDTSLPEIGITTTIDGVTTDLDNGEDDLFNTDVPVYVTVTDGDETITPDRVVITNEKGETVYDSNVTPYDPENPPVLTVDGEYTVTVEAEDEAGNYVKEVSDTITVDKTVNANVTPVDEDAPATKLDTTSDRYIPIPELVNDTITNKDVTVTVEKDEDVVKTEYVYVKNGSYTPEQLELITDWSETPPVFTEDGEYVVYVKVTDEAGNTAIISTDIIEVDKTPPAVEEVSNVEYISKTINVSDLNLTEVKVDGVVVDPDKNGNIVLVRTDKENEQTFVVEAKDAAGNVTVKEFTIADDATPPVVDVVLDPDKEATNTDVKATITAYDNETDIDEFSYTVTKDGVEYDGYEVISEDETSAELKFTEDGVYVVTATATDKDGNVATDSETIIIDRINPDTILPTPDKVADDGTKLYCNTAQVTVQTKDANLANVYVTKDGKEIFNAALDILVLKGSPEGTTYYIKTTDKAGNVTEETIKIYSEHPFGEWELVKAPTCTEKGQEKRTCTVCGHIEYRDIEATGHKEEIIPAVDNSCEGTGLTEGKKCSVCGEILKAQKTVPAHGHDYVGTVTKAPTCTETGVKTYTCTHDASHTYTETIKANGHNYRDTVTAPTCTEKGYTTHVCTECNDTYVDAYVDELGHDWDNGWSEITTEPSIDADGNNVAGVITHHCGRDDSHVYTEKIYPVAQNTTTKKIYTDLQVAMDEAVKGETVRLLVDFTLADAPANEDTFLTHTYIAEDIAATIENTDIDLDGHTLMINNVSMGKNCDIIDSQRVLVAENGGAQIYGSVGRLMLLTANVGDEAKLATTNSQMPYKTGTEDAYTVYQLMDLFKMQELKPVFNESDDSIKFTFRPTLGSIPLNKDFFAGNGVYTEEDTVYACLDEGLEMGARMVITEADGTVTVFDMMYFDYRVEYIYTNSRAFEIKVNDITVYVGHGNVEIISIVKSETGVEQLGEGKNVNEVVPFVDTSL